MKKRILVTGSEGNVGSELVPQHIHHMIQITHYIII
jgi:FlaA1/EpsC-like NDP-sugar epimerase